MASARLTLHDAIALFPEVKPDLPRLLKERQAELEERRTEANAILRRKNAKLAELWTAQRYQDAIKLEALVDKSPLFGEVRKLQLDVYAYETSLGKRDAVAQDEILKAREYPLANLLPAGKRTRGKYHLCPFHNEKTASFHIWKDNRYSCFGCNKHGDTIKFVMEYYKLDFKSAVRAINSYSI